MAQQIAVTVTCDVCGSAKDTQTRLISLDGKALEIDLCGKDGRALDKVAGKFVPYARKVTRRATAPGRRTITDRRHSADVREWAKGQGFKISDRGRIPEQVELEFEAAH
jgi:Lsr2